MRKIIKIACIILLLVSCFSFPLAAHAQSDADSSSSDNITWENPQTGYCVLLEDDADLLSETEKSALAAQMQEITAYGNVAFKSTTFNAFSASSYARDFYHDMFGQTSGTLFLIDMDNREIYIFSDGNIYKTLTTSYANTITDNVYRYASRADYYTCASEAFEQIQTLLAGQKIAQPMKYISNALLALILAALINYFFVMRLSSSSKPSSQEILNAISTKFAFTHPQKHLTKQDKVYTPPSSSGGGGSHRSSGGSHRSGGGGHRSGGGGGHRF